MKTIAKLFKNREKPKSFYGFIKAWAKRLITLPSLVKIILNSSILVIKGAKVGDMSVIGDATIFGKIEKLSIGDSCALGKCSIAVFSDLKIGNFVVINDGVRIMTASHSVTCPKWSRIENKVIIEDYAWIATGAVILPGVIVGRGAVVGAGAVVSKSVPAGHIVVGNPGRDVGNRRPSLLEYNPVELVAPYEAWVGKK